MLDKIVEWIGKNGWTNNDYYTHFEDVNIISEENLLKFIKELRNEI